jgi:hypothetical protein
VKHPKANVHVWLMNQIARWTSGSPDHIARLCGVVVNICGTDIARNPVPHAMTVSYQRRRCAFVNRRVWAKQIWTLDNGVTIVAAGQMLASPSR